MKICSKVTGAYNSELYNKTSGIPAFKGDLESNNTQSNPINAITPDYQVSAPISYSHIEDIKLPNNLTAHYYKLANGQKVIIVPKTGTTVVKTYVNTGSMNEPDNLRGISHYIEHNLFNGSEALGDKVFFDEVNKMGANTNASTSFSVTDYFISSQLLEDSDLENKIKLHAGMLQSPKFLQEKLDKEKKIVDSEINMCLSDDDSRAVSLTVKNLFNIKSTSQDLVAGTTDNIDALKREDVINYFNNNYYPANMVTVITGEVSPDQTMKLISKYFNSQKTPNQNRHFEKMTPITQTVRNDIISTKKQGAASIIMGFVGPENNNENDSVYLKAVNILLFNLANSRFKNIEKKYSTKINEEKERVSTRPNDKTAIILSSSVSEAYVEPLLKEIYNVIGNLAKQPPTKEEFDAVKNQLKMANSVSFENSHILNQSIGSSFINSTPYKLANLNSVIENMTYDDFINAARKYYDLNKVAITVVHPAGITENNINSNYSNINPNIGKINFTGKIQKKNPVNLQNIEEYTIFNNFDVILNNSESDVVNYSIQIKPQKYTRQKPALYDVLNYMIKNCDTLNYSKEELDKEIDKNGIIKSISAGNGLLLSADFLEDKTSQSLNLFAEQIQNPNFDQKVFEKAIKFLKDRYSTIEPNAAEKFNKDIFKNTPAEYTVQEKIESLNTITLDEVKKLYNDIFTTGQGQIVVSANFNKNPQLKQIIFNNAASYKPVQPKNITLDKQYFPQDNIGVHTVETKRNQAEIIMGYKFKDNGNIKDQICFKILTTILGGSSSSRLFSDLREKRHLAYAVGSEINKFKDIDVMSLKIETTTNNNETGEKTLDNIQKSIEGFHDNIKKITTEPVSDTELETAKRSIKTDVLAAFEMNETKNALIMKSTSTPYGLNLWNKQLEIIDSITPEDILRTAQYVFSGKPVYSISGTKESLDYNEKFLSGLKSM